MTLKEQLDAATARIAELEPKANAALKLEADLKASGDKVVKLEADLKASGEQVTKLETDLKASGEKVVKLEADLKASGEKVKSLEDSAKTADELAAEKAAANGLPPVKTDATKTAGNATDGAGLYAQYEKLKGRERTAFYREHAKVLDAYAEQLAKAA